MTLQTAENPLSDPRYKSALLHLQGGEWESGLSELDKLVESYPLDRELRALRQEMQLRSKIDEDERQDLAQERRRRLTSWVLRIMVVVILVGLIFWGVRTYSTWFQNQVVVARDRLEQEVLVIELAAKFRDAQDLLVAGRTEDAMTLFQEVAAVDPNYPGLELAMKQAETQESLAEKYQQAIALFDSGDLPAALTLMEEIAAEEPYYKDISIRIAEIKDKFFLGDILAQAENSFEEEEWILAISRYETLRALDPLYQSQLIEERLFRSYMNAANQALSEDSDSLEGLGIAETYFRKALALRPQDPTILQEQETARQTFRDRLFGSYVRAAQEVLAEQADSLEALALAEEYFDKALEMRPDDLSVRTQRDMASLYVQAQVDFGRGRYTQVIDALEPVYEADPEYALGTVRQTLYEAHVARGNSWVATGEYEIALEDYQEAALLAEEAPNSKLRLFESQLKVAEIRGILGDYQEAVVIYRGAIEIAEFGDSDLNERPELVQQLDQAERYAAARNYRQAYRVFRESSRTLLLVFPTVEVVIQSGDYLTMLASRYQTTIDAILTANNLDSARNISIGQKLYIPVRSTDGETGQ